MKVTKQNMLVFFGISVFLGIVALIFYLWQKNKPKTKEDLQVKILDMTNNVDLPNDPATPNIYGAQDVVMDNFGTWILRPGTCELIQTGIIDWTVIKDLSQADKNQLYSDIENCRGENVPLIQP